MLRTNTFSTLDDNNLQQFIDKVRVFHLRVTVACQFCVCV